MQIEILPNGTKTDPDSYRDKQKEWKREREIKVTEG